MATPRLILQSPGDPNLQELVDSTFAAFELLRPWCALENGSMTAKSIKQQALSYVKAIDLSIDAAQHGFNIAEEVLIFTELAHSFDEQNRQQYLYELVKHAERGRLNTVEAQTRFRDVRSIMEKLIKEAKVELKESPRDALNHDVTNLDDLKSKIDVLERFRDHVSTYAAWWNVLEMEHDSQKGRSESLFIDYNSLRDKFIVRHWIKLKQKYVDYTYRIQAYQDSNPEFLAYRKSGSIFEHSLAPASCATANNWVPDNNSTSDSPALPTPTRKKLAFIERFAPMYRLPRNFFK